VKQAERAGVVKENLALTQITSESQKAKPRDSDGSMFTGTGKSEGRLLSTVIATLDWMRPASSQAAGDIVETKKVFKGRMDREEGARIPQQEAKKSPALSRCENERGTAGESGQVRYPIKTTKVQGVQGREQGRQHRRALAEQGSSQTARGTNEANQLTENERKFGTQREKMWERMRQRKASAPQLVPALSAVKVRNKNPRGKTYRKAHYDPREVSRDKAEEILKRRLINDSKNGGQSKSRMWGKKYRELGGNRGFSRPYRERSDRPFNFDQSDDDLDGPMV